MQCSQPTFCTGFPNNGQYSPCYTQPQCPNIVGEGDVLSYVLPDGGVQCFFVPAVRGWTSYSTSSFHTSLPTCWNHNEAWFVRSILNTYPPAAPINQQPNCFSYGPTRCDINTPSNTYVQKFHSDACTSATDLQYFSPCLRRDWVKSCAGIQVEIPKEKCIFHYGTVLNRPCNCNNTGVIKPETKCAECTETPMCIDEPKPSHCCCEDAKKEKNRIDEPKPSHCCCEDAKKEKNRIDESKPSHCCCEDTKKEKNRSKKKNHTCECPKYEGTADKLCTTYADQAISCTDIEASCSQSSNRKVLEKTDIHAEIWYPRRKSRRKKTRSSSTVECDSACCLGSPCSDAD